MTKPRNEETVQIKVSTRVERGLRPSAVERNETVRTSILRALKGPGVAVTDGELMDRRKVFGR